MDEINFAPLGSRGRPLFIGIYRGIIIPGFLGWCRISSIHSMAVGQNPVQLVNIKIGGLKGEARFLHRTFVEPRFGRTSLW